MKNNFKKITTLFFTILLRAVAFSQYGPMPPFTLEIEAVTGTNLPGIHSCAFAQSGDKWLFIGGRTNGLHGLNSSGAFPPEYINNAVLVVDTSTWSFYQADLNQLPTNIADPMRSTNMEYIQDGNYLYMAGGYGFDSIAGHFVTFPTFTAIHVDSMIYAVINALPIASSIRQVIDTNMSICGGDLGKIGEHYYLCFGHNFQGRYSKPASPTFTQVYSNQIKKFDLNDDGTSMSLSSFSYQTDTNNFHRRDLNISPVIRPDGSFAIGAYGGVFQKNADLPYQQPILIEETGIIIDTGHAQLMSQYTCAIIPVYDSVTKKMYTSFLGGTSLYDFDHVTHTAVCDSLVPFIDDITTQTVNSSGDMEETVLPTVMSGLLGTNAKFIFNRNIPSYANEVIRIRDLPNSKTLIGYLFGGIRAQAANLGSSTANDTVYRIYITPNNTDGVHEISNSIDNAILFPNPSSQNALLLFHLKNTEQVRITLLDITGRQLQEIANREMQKGNHQENIVNVNLAAGIYICRIKSDNGERSLRLIIRK